MDSSKVLLLLAFVAAANCYVLTKADQYNDDNAPIFIFNDATFSEKNVEIPPYRQRREANFDEENLYSVEHLENAYTNDDAHLKLIDELYRPKRQNRNSVSVTADHQHRQGTNVNIEAQRNLWRSNNGRSSLDAQANYNRQFGHGGGRPNYGAGVTFRHRF